MSWWAHTTRAEPLYDCVHRAFVEYILINTVNDFYFLHCASHSENYHSLLHFRLSPPLLLVFFFTLHYVHLIFLIIVMKNASHLLTAIVCKFYTDSHKWKSTTTSSSSHNITIMKTSRTEAFKKLPEKLFSIPFRKFKLHVNGYQTN